eukprot:4610961-Prymnesium_polylepis.1
MTGSTTGAPALAPISVPSLTLSQRFCSPASLATWLVSRLSALQARAVRCPGLPWSRVADGAR